MIPLSLLNYVNYANYVVNLLDLQFTSLRDHQRESLLSSPYQDFNAFCIQPECNIAINTVLESRV